MALANGDTHGPADQMEVDETKYDVFISHCHEDEQFATDLKEGLNDRGFSCYLYCDEAEVGRSIIHNIVQGICRSNKTLLLITPHSLQSDYFSFEYAEAFSKQSRTRKYSVIPVLLDICPEELTGEMAKCKALLSTDEKFWDKLKSAVQDDTDVFDDSLPAGDVGIGLAFSFFYGYLILKLPTFRKTVEDLCQTKSGDMKPDLEKHVFNKLVILSPRSCRCPGDLNNFKGFQHFSELEHHSSRGGIKDRSYKSILYEITNSKGEVFYVAVEYATPILSMYEMHKGEVSHIPSILTAQELNRQRLKFEMKLTDIIRHDDPECPFMLLSYKDTDGMWDHDLQTYDLADLVCNRVQSDLEYSHLRKSNSCNS